MEDARCVQVLVCDILWDCYPACEGHKQLRFPFVPITQYGSCLLQNPPRPLPLHTYEPARLGHQTLNDGKIWLRLGNVAKGIDFTFRSDNTITRVSVARCATRKLTGSSADGLHKSGSTQERVKKEPLCNG